MRALIQRVSRAGVTVDGKTVSSIGPGLLVFLGVSREDDSSHVDRLVEKIPALRVFDDAEGKMNLGALDRQAEFLIISQFTLYANCHKGRRPSFDSAAGADKAKALYEEFLKKLSAGCPRVKAGVFGAVMQVELVNDGPVTLWIDTRD